MDGPRANMARRPPPPSCGPGVERLEAIEINVPVGCGDAPVFPGDIVVGDDDCVIVIPQDIAEEVAVEAVEMTACKDFVVERVKDGKSIIGLYPCTKDEHWAAFEEWRAQKGP